MTPHKRTTLLQNPASPAQGRQSTPAWTTPVKLYHVSSRFRDSDQARACRVVPAVAGSRRASRGREFRRFRGFRGFRRFREFRGFRERGFTLIELLVVLAVISVIAGGVAISASGARRGARLRRAAQETSVFIDTLRSQAAVKRRPLQVRFEPDAGTITARPIGLDGLGRPMKRRLPGQILIRAVERNGQVMTDQSVAITVEPSGYLSSFAVYLGSGEQRSLRLRWQAKESQWIREVFNKRITGGDRGADE